MLLCAHVHHTKHDFGERWVRECADETRRRLLRVEAENTPRTHVPVLALLVVLQLVLDHRNDNLVADKTSSVHDLLRLNPELRLARDLVTEHVTRREMAHAELVADARRLRALACEPSRQHCAA